MDGSLFCQHVTKMVTEVLLVKCYSCVTDSCNSLSLIIKSGCNYEKTD